MIKQARVSLESSLKQVSEKDDCTPHSRGEKLDFLNVSLDAMLASLPPPFCSTSTQTHADDLEISIVEPSCTCLADLHDHIKHLFDRIVQLSLSAKKAVPELVVDCEFLASSASQIRQLIPVIDHVALIAESISRLRNEFEKHFQSCWESDPPHEQCSKQAKKYVLSKFRRGGRQEMSSMESDSQTGLPEGKEQTIRVLKQSVVQLVKQLEKRGEGGFRMWTLLKGEDHANGMHELQSRFFRLHRKYQLAVRAARAARGRA